LARQVRRGCSAAGEPETTLRELDDRPLLADLLCTRGLVDLLRADQAAAEAALAEAEQMARSMNAGTTSMLNRAMERLRTAIAG
jgi:hypothetical protein